MPNPTLREICITTAYTLEQAAVDAPSLSARLLVAHALGLSRMDLVMQAERTLTTEEQCKIHTLIGRRAKGEPVALIVGHKEFYGREFAVNATTLVPRPDTECLIDYVLTKAGLPAEKSVRFADLGTGSGCIAVTLCCERPHWQGIMLDRAADTLAMACQNAAALGVKKRLFPLCADLTKMCFKNEIFELIISNPPYVSEEEYQRLSKEIRSFEPRRALQPATFRVGMSFELTGLEHIRAMAQNAHRHMKSGGVIVVEHGYRQGLSVQELFAQEPYWECIQTHQDLAGKDRFCTARKCLF